VIDRRPTLRRWFQQGDPFIWLNALALCICLVAVVGLVSLLVVRSVAYFWPAPVMQFNYPVGAASQVLAGQLQREQWVATEVLNELGEHLPEEQVTTLRLLVRLGNRDLGGDDFRWLLQPHLSELSFPRDMVIIERRHGGPVYGYLMSLHHAGKKDATEASRPPPPGVVCAPHDDGAALAALDGAALDAGAALWRRFQDCIAKGSSLRRQQRSQATEIAELNRQLEPLRRSEPDVQDLQAGHGPPAVSSGLPAGTADAALFAARERASLQARLRRLQANMLALREQLDRYEVIMRVADGREIPVAVESIIRAYRPNALGVVGKVRVFVDRIAEFLTADPRAANAEGGIFPALFGTVLMVIVMSILVMPLGVLVAVYLKEYARQGLLTRVIRITVHNLAGVPSVVYGMFGLGFFVYAVGGHMDQWLFAERLPAPTFGTPGLFWAALTLALLTLPVVIVVTEEGLASLPRHLREGSLALGATRFQTIVCLVLPTAGPALMTGLILAVARAAGEVAPLMLVGVVKLAPSLPLDGEFPYLHLERKFMHLGYHIYDVGFQSASGDGSGALAFATSLLLVVVVGVLNLSAFSIRNRLRKKVRVLDV
jgi:phosphate transport system permease protein